MASLRAQQQFDELGGRHLPPDLGYTYAAVVGDLDGDGHPDLVVGGSRNRVYRNDGTGRFANVTTAAGLPPAGACCLALGDLDGDGDLDLVIGDSGQQNRLYLNDGAGTFTDATAGRMPVDADRTYSVALGDVDGDGDPDLVIGNRWQQNRLYLNDGTGSFTDATAARMPMDSENTTSVALGDVDGDVDVDLVIGNYGEQNRLYLNDGSGTFTDVTATHMPTGGSSTSALALGDVDGDGDVDIVAGGYWSESRLYLNDGAGHFRDASATHLPPLNLVTKSLALGDLDDDGDLDLFIGGYYHTQNRLFLNDGTGVFTDATSFRLPADTDSTTSVALADFDGDGDLDLFVGNDYPVCPARDCSVRNSIYLNLLRQIDGSHPMGIGQSWRLEIHARHGPARQTDIALTYVSSATASLPFGTFGTLRLDPAGIVALAPIPIPQPSGIVSLTIPVPNVPDLVGTPVHTQALVVQWPTQAKLTNLGSNVIAR